MPRMLVLVLAALAASPAAAEGAADFVGNGKANLDLRYRFEAVEQDDKPESADANTLRIRLDLASGEVAGFSGHLQADHIEALGDPQYDDTRNGQAQYPVVADPQGTDLNQAWLQYRGAKDTVLRLGRQMISIGNERFVGPVGWRQNEQSFDAVRLDTRALPGTSITYAWVDRVMRVFGPDEGMPPAELSSDSHLLDARVTSLSVGALALYGYHATLHPFQGWADKFTTTPSAGIEDLYLGVSLKLAGWKCQAVWHEFEAEATDARYGSELDFIVSRRFGERYEVLAKYADYRADELFTDTRKVWLQVSAAF